MSLDTGRGQLYSAFKTLRERWESTKERWSDMVRQRFTDEVWEPLEQRMQAALAAIDRLAGVVSRARRECDDSD